jgi:hypothetical protein
MIYKVKSCRILSKRSNIHREEINLMLQNGLYGQAMIISKKLY